MAGERFGDPPQGIHGAFSGQRQGWKTPKNAAFAFSPLLKSQHFFPIHSRDSDEKAMFLRYWQTAFSKSLTLLTLATKSYLSVFNHR